MLFQILKIRLVLHRSPIIPSHTSENSIAQYLALEKYGLFQWIFYKLDSNSLLDPKSYFSNRQI
jgi:hypothetical protein